MMYRRNIKEYNQNDTNSGSSLLALRSSRKKPESILEHSSSSTTAGDLHLMVELLHLQEV